MSNYTNSLYRDYEKLEIKNTKITKENKLLKLRLDILESENQRLERNCNKQEKIIENIEIKNQNIIDEKNKIIEAQNKKIIEQNKKNW